MASINVFELYHSDYEEHTSWKFFHFDKTNWEFKQDCLLLLRQYGKEFMNEKDGGWISASDWLYYIANKLPELGYTLIQSQSHFGHFGSGIIGHGTPYDGTELRDEDKEWEKKVGKELFKMALEKNKAIDDKMHERFKKEEMPERLKQDKNGKQRV
jgi:hypothetical protein